MESTVAKYPIAHNTQGPSESPSSPTHGVEHHQHGQTALGQTGAETTQLPEDYFRSRFFIGTYVGVAVSLIAASGSFGYIAPLITAINEDVGPNPNYVWIGYTYTLTSACTFTLTGRFTDLFGRRYVVLGGNVLALIGALVGARATSVNMVIGAMVLQGVATSSQLAFQFVMGELVPIGKRFITMSSMFCWSILGGGLGAAFGLLFQERTAPHWRTAFYFLAALDVLAFVILFVCYYPPTFTDLEKRKTKMQVLKEFDFVGLVLFTGGFLLFLMALSWGGAVYPWDSAHVLACLVIGLVTLIVFVAWELIAKPPAPFMPMHLFSNYQWVASVICLSIGANFFYAMSLVWPQMIKLLWPISGTNYAFLATTPNLVLIVGQAAGAFMANMVNPKLVVVSGTFMGTAIVGGAACANEDNFHTVLALVIVGFLLIGFQEGVCATLCTIALRDQREIGTGSGVASTFRSGISAIGSAVYGSVLRNSLSDQIPQHVPKAATAAGLPAAQVPGLLKVLQGTAKAGSVPGLTPEILDVATHAYRSAASVAFRNVIITAVAFGTISVVASWFTPAVDETKKNIVSQTLAKSRPEQAVQPEK